MTRQSNDHDQQWGWYDEIVRGQYYAELIPAYEALQERMRADHDGSLACMLFKGCVCLLRLVWRPVNGFRCRAQRSAGWVKSWRQARQARVYPG